MKRVRAAAVQMSSGPDRSANLAAAERLVRDAAADRARLVALPENFAVMAREGVVIAETEPLDGPIVAWGRDLARELEIDLLLGSIPEASRAAGRRRNTSVLVARDGRVVTSYTKLHLFDVSLEGRELLESKVVDAGDAVVDAAVDWGHVGLSVCYDLRFPELYRALRRRGAEVLTVPSAFTATTGPAHWHVLLRARAIENQAFVVAPAQVGRHGPGRESYGHALVVDPWGEILADAGGEGEGLAIADLDPERLAAARRAIPCFDHAHDWLLGGRFRDPGAGDSTDDD